jgi:hypothetical protein
MPVPSTIADLSTTAASNSPAGTDLPSTLDDHIRALGSFIAYLRDSKQLSMEATVASAATTDIGAAASYAVKITGTTTITSFGTDGQGPRFIRFTGALTLTHNASSLILPGGANITTAAGDTCIAIPIPSGAGWYVSNYQRAAIVPSFSAYQSSQQSISTGTFTKVTFTTEEWDLGSMYDTSNSRFTPTVPGVYLITANVGNSGGPAPAIASVYKNGSEYKRGVHFNSSALGTPVSAMVRMNGSTDYVEIYAFQGSGSSVNTAANAAQTYFQGTLVRAD